MKINALDIPYILRRSYYSKLEGNPVIDTLLTDSRDLINPKSTAFFALKTDSNNGLNYMKEVYNKGVKVFVADNDNPYPMSITDILYVDTKSAIDALQVMGDYARCHTWATVIGITGSRGKTVLKENLYEMLRGQTKVVRSPRSYNSQIGVPLSLWELEERTNVGIFEAGISECGEMEKLQKIIRPNIGVFTSLTDEHNAGFESLEQKAREKAILFKDSEVVFIPAGNEVIRQAVEDAAASAEIIEIEGDGKDMAINVAEYIAKRKGIEINHGYTYNPNISSRMDVTETLKNCIIVYDSFTTDTRSVLDALNFAHRHLTPGRQLTFILSDPYSYVDHQHLTYLLKVRDVQRFIGIGPSFSDFSAQGIQCEAFENVGEFMSIRTISDFENEVILVKGAMGSGADEIKTMLEAPRHETVMEVDLGAIVNNFNYFKSKLNPGTGLVAMVKAAGYGVGALEIAKTLQNQGAAYLAVAVIDEGVELRRAGITMPIIVMNPISTNYKALFDNQLEPSVFSMREYDMLVRNARKYSVTDYPIHIKLDTGMHRVGFLEDELDELISNLQNTPELKAASIFSHLATADCLDQDEYTEMQLETFERMSSKIRNALPYSALRHVLNTAGILRYPQYQYDMARLGIGLYGVSPIGGYKMQPVARLLSTIISMKKWGAGITIGYGRKGVVTRDSVIATVPIGYADGLNRHLSNGAAYVLVNGVKCPIIGNICMDQCMVDVTEANANIGDTVEIFGPDAPIERLSETLGTIPYEILTSVSPRVKRIYFRE